MVNECKEKDTFTINGRSISTEINDCIEYLDTLLRTSIDSNVEYSKEDLLRECKIRDYFNERFNEDTVKDYDLSFFNALFEERDNEFIQKIIYEYERRGVNIEENGNPSYKEENDEDSIVKLEKDIGILSGNQEIKDLNEEISILTVKNTSTSLYFGNKEIKYIDSKEMILEKLSNLQENPPIVVSKETNKEPSFLGLLRRIFGFLPWFNR
jgi:hypothetical protein